MYVEPFDIASSDVFFYSEGGCPYCGYKYISVVSDDGGFIYTCGECGELWQVKTNTAYSVSDWQSND